MSAPSIEQLQELVLPAPVSYLPQTWGWLAVLLLALFALVLWGALKYRRWRQDRYRREALARLGELEQALADTEQRLPALRELPELLKRVALSMPGQPDVASLDGERWQAFLARHSRQPLPADFSRQLAALAYAPASQLRALPAERDRQLLNQCRQWVESHHVAA